MILYIHINFELQKILFNLHLHSHESCWIKNLVSFALENKTHIGTYESSIVLQIPPHLLTWLII